MRPHRKDQRMITLKNDALIVSINPFGAELSGIKDTENATEYLWQGDPSVWSGQSPILFPIVGRLASDRFIYEGETYTLPKHGFARRSPFTVVATEPTYAAFSLKSGEETKRGYPFDFELLAEYRLDGKTITVTNTVCNTGDKTMYFSLGAHPGFNIDIGDIVEFSGYERLAPLLLDDAGLYIKEDTALIEHGNRLVITENIFENDALFFRNLKSDCARIIKKETGKAIVEMTFGGAEFLGLWAKPGAPYVCIEPWCGICDSVDVSGKIEEKPYVKTLGAGEKFVFTYEIRILA